MVRDINNNNLKSGDNVYFTKYGDDSIYQGIVEKINNENIYIKYNAWNGNKVCRMQHHQAEERIVKI